MMKIEQNKSGLLIAKFAQESVYKIKDDPKPNGEQKPWWHNLRVLPKDDGWVIMDTQGHNGIWGYHFYLSNKHMGPSCLGGGPMLFPTKIEAEQEFERIKIDGVVEYT